MRGPIGSLWRIALLGAPMALGLATPVPAQTRIPRDRPSDQPLELPALPPADAERPAPILPPVPMPERPDLEGLAGGLTIVLRRVEFEGPRILPLDALERLAAPYLDRPVGWAELLELRDRVTLAIVDRGYRTSGATIPEQTIREGVLRIELVEGRIADVEIETDGRFRPSVLRRRLRGVVEGIVDVPRLEARLRALQRDRRIERVEARLDPGPARGTSILRVRIEEASPLALRADFDNARSPAIGSLGGRFSAGFDNALGLGDAVELRSDLSEGLRQFAGSFSIPVSPWETLFTTRFQWSSADIVEEPIGDEVVIASRSRTVSLELRQPLPALLGGQLETFVRGELRRAKTTLDGISTPFFDGYEGGVSKVSALRFGLEWTHRGRTQAIALRSLASVGLDVLDATHQADDLPDGRFLAWLGQIQWARRLPWLGVELVGRAELQLADSPLLPLEQITIGGRYTVRGYRENVRVGDDGVVGGIETRIPLYTRVEPSLAWELIPFVDAGRVWRNQPHHRQHHTLVSVGLGTRFGWSDRAELEVFWGHAFQHVHGTGKYDLQNDGIHFRTTLRWP
ncbi:MAG: ShlB/FhaC/HecB family hemolysin secretion/activation protein [Myxococcota bacterium]